MLNKKACSIFILWFLISSTFPLESFADLKFRSTGKNRFFTKGGKSAFRKKRSSKPPVHSPANPSIQPGIQPSIQRMIDGLPVFKAEVIETVAGGSQSYCPPDTQATAHQAPYVAPDSFGLPATSDAGEDPTGLVKFQDGGAELKIDSPNIACPTELETGKVCYASSAGKGKIVLDPGHNLKVASIRNGWHDEVHEGRANMTTALLARQLLLKCAKWDESSGTGIDPSMVTLSHWPGEETYGTFENSPRNSTGTPIGETGGKNLFNHVNSLLDGVTGKTSVISIHADAPDYAKEKNRMSEFPAVYYRSHRSHSIDLAKDMMDSMIRYTGDRYTDEQKTIFMPRQEGDSVKYPTLTLSSSSSNGRKSVALDDGSNVNVRSEEFWRAGILRVGNPDTDVVLLEAFFMDGANVGASVQRELSDKANPPAEIKLSYKRKSEDNFKNKTFIKTNLTQGKEKTAEDGSKRISYSYSKGEVQEGLKVSQLYIRNAQAIAAGIQKQYSCREGVDSPEKSLPQTVASLSKSTESNSPVPVGKPTPSLQSPYFEPVPVQPVLASVEVASDVSSDPSSGVVTESNLLAVTSSLLDGGSSHLTSAQKDRYILRIGEEEWGNNPENIIQWNRKENFLSLGLGHFLWMPTDYSGPEYGESFGEFVNYLIKHRGIKPEGLPKLIRESLTEKGEFTPKSLGISSREDFYKVIGAEKTALKKAKETDEEIETPWKDLQDWLLKRRRTQLDFMVWSSDKKNQQIVAVYSNEKDKQQKIASLINEMKKDKKGQFALVDYANFKGAGLRNGGWGLRQVLETMLTHREEGKSYSDLGHAFSVASREVLVRRAKNAPANKKSDYANYLADPPTDKTGGWTKRLRQYAIE